MKQIQQAINNVGGFFVAIWNFVTFKNLRLACQDAKKSEEQFEKEMPGWNALWAPRDTPSQYD